MSRMYDERALEAIASTIGPCLEGRDRGEMLERIEQAAQDWSGAQDYNAKRRATMCAQLEAAGAGDDLLEYVRKGGMDLPIEPEPSRADDRRRLSAAAVALRRADQLLGELGLTGAGHLAWEEVKRGLKVRADYLAEFADAVDAAASGLTVKPGPEPSAFDRLICALADIVDHFAGWRGSYTYVDLEEAYKGRFLAVVRACSEPLGIKKKDEALAKAISRAFARDKLTA
jgi:hypothetical protein